MIRAMTKEDVPGAERAWDAAYATLRAAHHLPLVPRTPESVRQLEARIAYLLGIDPTGSWVAIDGSDEQVVGVSQALVREDVWVLSLLGVSPRCQDRGTGRALLDASLAYGEKTPFGLILCSRDPRAARRYSRAGFDLHPSVTASGRVDRRGLPRSTAAVREGTEADTGFAADLARRLRGGYHDPDLEYLLAEGCRWLVLPDRGYTIARGGKPVVLAAIDETSATELLFAVLAASGPDEIVELNWITARQQWAVRAALEAGLELHPVGPVMTRAWSLLRGPTSRAVPSAEGALGSRVPRPRSAPSTERRSRSAASTSRRTRAQ
jgi:ribosomal protein S18 acetylase RimI-like enzyme